MIEEIDFENGNDNEKLRVVYISRIGKDSDGKNIFHFLCTMNIDEVWGEEWMEKPACNCRNLQPDSQYYEYIMELKTDIDFVLGQENCCCSYQDVCDGCVAMAYENIDGYEEYPSIRLIFGFGDTVEEVEEQLAKRDLILHYIEI